MLSGKEGKQKEPLLSRGLCQSRLRPSYRKKKPPHQREETIRKGGETNTRRVNVSF